MTDAEMIVSENTKNPNLIYECLLIGTEAKITEMWKFQMISALYSVYKCMKK
jgi:hypothetical protein